MGALRRVAGAVVLVLGLSVAGVDMPASAASSPAAGPSPAVDGGMGQGVPEERRQSVLGAGWASSSDVAWHLQGDSAGLHVLVARESEGYAWRDLALLRVDGVESDLWVGNACLTGSGRLLSVVFGPRAFTNRADLMYRGGFAALVDVGTGVVTRVPAATTLAYFSPGCGSGDDVALTAFSGADRPTDAPVKTRVVRVSGRAQAVGVAPAVTVAPPVELDGQVTSAIPVRSGFVAARGREVVAIDPAGKTRRLAAAAGVPFELTADGASGVAFMDVDPATVGGSGSSAGSTQDMVGVVSRVSVNGGPVAQVARGRLQGMNLRAGRAGTAFVVGDASAVQSVQSGGVQAGGVQVLPGTTSDAAVSSHGRLATAVDDSQERAARAEAQKSPDRPVTAWDRSRAALSGRVTRTGTAVQFRVALQAAADPNAGRRQNPPPAATSRASSGPASAAAGSVAAAAGSVAAGSESPTDPVDQAATCAVPRNDVNTMVFQPRTRQVEWAVDQAVQGTLTLTRPATLKGMNVGSSWSPQGSFPGLTLAGGGRAPAQVMLGILAQESNLSQASWQALIGEYGNPLVGNFYGRAIYDNDPDNDWVIDWAKADCGYGISQVTDGMRKTHVGTTVNGIEITAAKQRQVGMDYATNIAAGLRILQSKWNETRDAGLIINNGDPSHLENWYFAIWAYNSGFHPQNGTAPWGVGWLNNPANSIYRLNRSFFNALPSDAAHPQDWPYQEKVIGFATFGQFTTENQSFNISWWNSDANRRTAIAPVYAFCSPSENSCWPGEKFPATGGPCARSDYMCWWHLPVSWKDCSLGQCGRESLRYSTAYANSEPPDQDNVNYPNSELDKAVCATTGSGNLAGLPANALVVDNRGGPTVAAASPHCPTAVTTRGTFGLAFAADSTGNYPSKVDFHQVGDGYGGHYWMAHTRSGSGSLKVTGTWTLTTQPLTVWTRVFVHVPHSPDPFRVITRTQQALYEINNGAGVIKKRAAVIDGRTSNEWVSLGVVQMNGRPSITLTSDAFNGRGDDRVIWDAVAFQPLSATKPTLVAGLGDSFSSGEGSGNFSPESDHDGQLGDGAGRNACHRSTNAWVRKAALAPELTRTMGSRADAFSTTMDLQFHACSGARTYNVIPRYAVATPVKVPATETFPEITSVEQYGFKDGRGQYGELPQLDKGYVDDDTDIVTLSIGGNDALFTEILRWCVTGDCQEKIVGSDQRRVGLASPQQIESVVGPAVRIVLDQIRLKAPHAQIILMGYPRLFNPVNIPDTDPSHPCGPQVLWPAFSAAEAEWANTVGSKLLNVMSAAVDNHNQQVGSTSPPARFQSPDTVFEGHRLCDPDSGLNGLTLNTVNTPDGESKVLSMGSYHPNLLGTDLYAQALNSALRSVNR